MEPINVCRIIFQWVWAIRYHLRRKIFFIFILFFLKKRKSEMNYKINDGPLLTHFVTLLLHPLIYVFSVVSRFQWNEWRKDENDWLTMHLLWWYYYCLSILVVFVSMRASGRTIIIDFDVIREGIFKRWNWIIRNPEVGRLELGLGIR